MQIAALFLIAVTLALDAMTVAVTNGISCAGFRRVHALWMGLYFGMFQFIMPLIGFYLGSRLIRYVESYDHWLALLLLSLIGGIMVYGALRPKQEETEAACEAKKPLSHPKLLVQAVATSIDALAVGVTLPLLGISIWISAGVVGAMAFVLSLVGGLMGQKLGRLFRNRAELAGGLVLIGLGVKIFLEHVLGS